MVFRLALSSKSSVEKASLSAALNPRNYLIAHGVHELTLID
jgi:hypothetical protein